MGIQGLLPLLRSIEEDVHVSAYEGAGARARAKGAAPAQPAPAGKRVAIDGYSWLHKGVYTCALDLCLGNKTDRFVNYFLHKVCVWPRAPARRAQLSNPRAPQIRMLRHFKVTPLVVFDGARLPSKAATEAERRASREENMRQGRLHLQANRRDEALRCFQKAVDVTPDMANQLAAHLRREGVEFVVAPYEADAQMAFLARRGDVVAVLSEGERASSGPRRWRLRSRTRADSDLLVFGCPRVLFKLDEGGRGREIRLERLADVREVNFSGWSLDWLQQMCILSGCDYADGIRGLGLKTAHRLIQSHRGDGLRAIRKLQFEGRAVPRGFELVFRKAHLAFKHQRVFDPLSQAIVHLTPLPDQVASEFDNTDFLGPAVPPDIAPRVCRGELHPETHAAFAPAEPAVALSPRPPPPPTPPPPQKNTLASYFGATPRRDLARSLSAPAATTSPATPLGKRESRSESTPAPRVRLVSRFFADRPADGGGGGAALSPEDAPPMAKRLRAAAASPLHAAVREAFPAAATPRHAALAAAKRAAVAFFDGFRADADEGGIPPPQSPAPSLVVEFYSGEVRSAPASQPEPHDAAVELPLSA